MNVNQLELYVNKSLISREVGTVGTVTTDINSTDARIYEYTIATGNLLSIRTMGAIVVSLNMFDTSGNLLLPQITSTGKNFTVIPGKTYFLLVDSTDAGKFSLYVNGGIDQSVVDLWTDPNIVNSLPFSYWSSTIPNKLLGVYEQATIGTIVSIIKTNEINIFELNIVSGSTLHVSTLGGLDTILQLRDSAGNILKENDDATISTYDSTGKPITIIDGKFSRIDYAISTNNKYYVVLHAQVAGTTSITFTGVQLKPDYVITSNTTTNSGSSSNNSNNTSSQSNNPNTTTNPILSIARGKATRSGFIPKDEILAIQSINSAILHCKSKFSIEYVLNRGNVLARHPVTNVLYELPTVVNSTTDIMVDFSGYTSEFFNQLSNTQIQIQYMTLEQGK